MGQSIGEFTVIFICDCGKATAVKYNDPLVAIENVIQCEVAGCEMRLRYKFDDPT